MELEFIRERLSKRIALLLARRLRRIERGQVRRRRKRTPKATLAIRAARGRLKALE